jgi:DNA-directed RNA polymerase specialized sigma24 family protein
MAVSWPPLEDGYNEEFGWVDPEVYRAAGEVWVSGGHALALKLLQDEATGLRFMRKAAALVTRRRADAPIDNLPGYIFQTYRRLLLAELETINAHREREREALDSHELSWMDGSGPEDVERNILVEQLMGLMDEWTREVFELLVIGHSYEFIAGVLGTRSNRVRSKFHKQMKRLMKQVNR